MSGPEECSSPPRSGRILALGTFVLAAAAAAVLAVGGQDVRLLRLGLVAALWAALLGAFAAARTRREISSGDDRVDQLRTVYELELEREVAARQEHVLTVELKLREQNEQAERREIEALHAEIAALRANLEQLISRDAPVARVDLADRVSLVDRVAQVDRIALVDQVALGAESARLVPLPTHCRKGHAGTAAAGVEPKARNLSVAGSSARAQGIADPPSQDRQEPFRSGLGRAHQCTLDSSHLTASNGFSNTNDMNAQRDGRHDASSSESEQASETGTQRSVDDLLAAYGAAPLPRRRRSRNGSY